MIVQSPTRAALALLPNCFQTPKAEPRGIHSIKPQEINQNIIAVAKLGIFLHIKKPHIITEK